MGVARLVLVPVAAGIGARPVPAGDVLTSAQHKVGLGGGELDRVAESVLWNVRFPRIVLALPIGASLRRGLGIGFSFRAARWAGRWYSRRISLRGRWGAPAELPLGVLTALLGSPFFFWLLRRTRRRQGGVGLRGVCRERARAGDAVVVVLHDLGFAAAYAHRVAVLRAGRIAADGPPGEVFSERLLSEVHDLPVDVLSHPRTGAPWRPRDATFDLSLTPSWGCFWPLR